MLNNVILKNVLVLDIETVPSIKSFEELPVKMQELWEEKAKWKTEKNNISPAEFYQDAAGIHAEFSKIICISVGYFKEVSNVYTFKLKSFFGHDEKQILENFSEMLNKYFNKPEQLLCGHNAKEFDFPFIARRMLIHGIPLPSKLNMAGKKPWEIPHLDTMELWKFGDYKNYTSLNLLAAVFNIATPKDDISGKDVRNVYWEENNLERIVTYCQKDVIAVAQLLLRFKGEPILKEKDITIA